MKWSEQKKEKNKPLIPQMLSQMEKHWLIYALC